MTNQRSKRESGGCAIPFASQTIINSPASTTEIEEETVARYSPAHTSNVGSRYIRSASRKFND